MIKIGNLLKKLMVLRLIWGLIILFCLPANSFLNVKAGEPYFNDPNFLEQKYLKQINAPVWLSGSNFSGSGENIVVAIIDEGVDFLHPDLQGADSGIGWNFLDGNNVLAPKGPHGTRLAGIIAARAGNLEGIAGIAPNAKIMPLIACDKQAGCSPSAVVSAIYYAADNGASVINLSFGDTAGYSEIYSNAIRYAAEKGVVVVAAAGGIVQGADLAYNPISPVCNEPVIGVSSVDENDNLPVWANFGSCVDVYAPGTNIYTTTSATYDSVNYGYYNGSSYSAAQVSAWAALIKQSNPNMNTSQIVELLKNRRLDVYTSLKLIQAAQKPAIVQPKVKSAFINPVRDDGGIRPRTASLRSRPTSSLGQFIPTSSVAFSNGVKQKASKFILPQTAKANPPKEKFR